MYFVPPFIFFRALLEGERVVLQDANRRMGEHQRERVIGTLNKNVYFCYRLISKSFVTHALIFGYILILLLRV